MVYALTLPAITLEGKTICGMEEHTHTEECYQDDKLICDKEEHQHTEDCYEKEEQEQEPVEEENTQPELTEPSDEVQTVAEPEESKQDESNEEEQQQESTQVTSEGFNLNSDASKISSVDWYYIKDGTPTNIDVTGNTEIPGDAILKLSVHYQGIQIEHLKANYNRTLIFDLPDILRNAVAQGSVMSGSTKVGDVTVDNRKVKVQFNEHYLNGLISGGKTTIDGDFYVTGEANLSNLPETGKRTITIAGKDYTLNFGENLIAHYGKVEVKKSCEKIDPNSDYIKYTITVNAGEDGCPDVKVVDTFLANYDLISYININKTNTNLKGKDEVNQLDPYEIVEPGKAHGSIYLGATSTNRNPIPSENTKNDSETGSLVWNIGTMASKETRTLTYFAKLKDGVALNGKTINNQAVVYSKSIKRVYGNNEFTPKVNYSMNKERVDAVVRQDDGSYKIDYKLYFKLNENESNYPVKDLVFFDCLNYEDVFSTDSNILKYVKYDSNSFNLSVQKKGDSNYSEVDKSNYVVQWSNDRQNYVTEWNGTDNPTCFKLAGKEGNPIIVNPGDSYYVTYTLIVKPGAFAEVKKDSIDIKNRFLLSASNVEKQFGDAFDRVWCTEQINTYKWDEKSVESATTEDTTIEMSGNRYIKNNGNYSIDNSTENTFKVPTGSYKYTVMVNDTLGDWDATSVQMTDKLNSNKMQYVGYVKIEALEETKKENNLSSTGERNAHINTLDREYKSKEEKWVKIDGETSFTLKSSDLGWNNNKYAYRFTYYAKPVNQDTYGNSKVTNTFTLTGNVVGRDGTLFDISNISSNKEVTISGNYKMNVKKSSWYYESPKVDSGNWAKGKIYWVVEVSGTAIKKDTIFKDTISKDKTNSYLYDDSLVGIYKGNLPDNKTITSFKDLEELKTTSGLVDVKGEFSNLKITNNSELSITANKNIELKDQKLYMIIATEPSLLPTDYRDYNEYENQISTNDDGEHDISWGSATKTLCGGADILKELGQIFTYDGDKITNVEPGRDEGDTTKIFKNGLTNTGPGLYASWVFKLNYAGELSGTYRVLEKIPEGMDLAYIRVKWIGPKQDTIQSKKITNLGSEWTPKQTKDAPTDNGRTETTTYYVNGNQALIELGDFIAGQVRDDYSVDVQVVCKVKDSDVLHGIEKTFTNEVELQTADGQKMNNATSSATLKGQNLEKSMTSNQPANEKVKFTIKANPLGQEIPVSEGATLKLIDKLSNSLLLDTKSIKAIDKDGAEVDIKSALKDDNTLEIEIPNDKAITITYEATVNAPPGQKVDFSNEAYWEGYKPSTGVKVEKKEYSYAAGGTVSSGNNIKLNILKKDQNNLSTSLSGADFTMVECKRLEDGTIKQIDETIKWEGTTDANGTLSFGSGSATDHVMQYNTIYKVTETKAPKDYVKSEQELYIMVPRVESGKTDYSDYVKKCIQDERIKVQYQETYVLTVLNHKGEITVEKKFKNPANQDMNPVTGTYRFGLYENKDGTEKLLQTISIQYDEGSKDIKSEKFINLELDKTYYVYELDDQNNPIKDSGVHVINRLEYITSYSKDNAVQNGDTVTVTNQSRVKQLPSTGSYGTLIYRISGAMLILASLIILININKKNHLNDTSKKRRKQ
ncbi:SpaA isopeptide-forming pilin-related protein [Holdemanella porci]|uniref:SpaA isopeptide-forming pilin-related protein n=1 Tax=Holdemanella porci TaxID=2652276 RepID=UPI0022E7D10E|nr:SpaA isopeptide-forming pilin-related protein [Holdemanella porci]